MQYLAATKLLLFKIYLCVFFHSHDGWAFTAFSPSSDSVLHPAHNWNVNSCWDGDDCLEIVTWHCFTNPANWSPSWHHLTSPFTAPNWLSQCHAVSNWVAPVSLSPSSGETILHYQLFLWTRQLNKFSYTHKSGLSQLKILHWQDSKPTVGANDKKMELKKLTDGIFV